MIVADTPTVDEAIPVRDRLHYVRLAGASAFGLGLAPIAPGSFGALLGVAGHVAIAWWLPVSAQGPALVLFLALVIAANHVLTPWAQAYWNDPDPGHFVLDEVAGYLVVPILFHHGQLWQVALWGFLFFRIFDIIKIPPARQVDEQIHDAWGIVLDDLISGVYAVMALYALMWIGTWLGIGAWLISNN